MSSSGAGPAEPVDTPIDDGLVGKLRRVLWWGSAKQSGTRPAVVRADGSVDQQAVGSMDQLFEGAEVISPLAPPPEPLSELLKAGVCGAAPSPKPDMGLSLVPIQRDQPASPAGEGTRANVLAGIDFVFRPMWDPACNVIATYLCTPQVKLSDGDGAVGGALLTVAGDPDAMARLDTTTIARVKQDLKVMTADGRRVIIAMPIHFETLCSVAQRRRCAAEIAAIPEPVKQYLVVEVVGVPAGVLKSRLMEVIAPLRLHCRAVSLRVALETIDFMQIHGTGITAVGADITDLAKSELIVMQQLGRFQRAAEKAGVATFLHGAQSRSLVAAAVGAGFHYVDGDAVATPVTRPDRIVPFHFADLPMPR